MNSYQSDDELANDFQAGVIAAQDELFNRCTPVLIKFARSKGFSDADAEDLAQETFAVCVEKISSFIRGTSLRRWLVGIEDKLMKRRWEKLKSETAALRQFSTDRSVEISLVPDTVAESVRAAEFLTQIQVCMVLVKNQTYMDVVSLSCFGKLSYSEIDAKLGLKKGVAKMYFHRGVKEIKKIMESDIDEEMTHAQEQ